MHLLVHIYTVDNENVLSCQGSQTQGRCSENCFRVSSKFSWECNFLFSLSIVTVTFSYTPFLYNVLTVTNTPRLQRNTNTHANTRCLVHRAEQPRLAWRGKNVKSKIFRCQDLGFIQTVCLTSYIHYWFNRLPLNEGVMSIATFECYI